MIFFKNYILFQVENGNSQIQNENGKVQNESVEFRME